MYYRSSPMARQSFCVFQLAPSTHRIGATGSGLLPTPTTQQIDSIVINLEEGTISRRTNKQGKKRQQSLKDALIEHTLRWGLIPTLTEMDSTGATVRMKSMRVMPGYMAGVTLSRLIAMLPTPVARDWKGPKAREYNGKVDSLPGSLQFLAGINGPLNPQFAGEMMGFPVNWTVSPFLSGERKA